MYLYYYIKKKGHSI